MKMKQLTFPSLFSDNKITFIFALIVAVIVWVLVAMFSSPVEERVIENVPVVIDLEDSTPSKLGLQVFGQSEFTVSVKVSGKRYIISPTALGADDIVVTANTNYVDSAGKNSLPIEVNSKSENAEFKIVECSEEAVEVFFDHLVEDEFDVVADVTFASDSVEDGLIRGDSVVSDSLAAISGPATEMAKIERVIAKVKIDEPLLTTATYDTTIIPLNEYGGTLRYLTVNGGDDAVTVTIPVYRAATLQTSVLFKNTPSYFSEHQISYTCSPSSLNVAIPVELSDSTKVVTVGSIDFSDINIGANKFTFNSKDIVNAVVKDDVAEISVDFDMTGFDSTAFTVTQTNIEFENVPAEMKVSLAQTQPLSVTIIGLPNEIEALTQENIFAKVDCSKLVQDEANQTALVEIYIDAGTSCWAYGEYEIIVTAQ